MARNRKSESGFRVGPALTALVLCSIFVTMGIGFVWFKNQITVLGEQIKARETQLAQITAQNRQRRDQLATLCSPVALDERVKKLNLGLGPPALAQVIHLTETPPENRTAPATVEAAADQRRAETVPLVRNN